MNRMPGNVEAVRRYQAKNRELLRQKRQEYCASNPEKLAAYAKLYRANPANKEILDRIESKRRAKPGFKEKHREDARLYAAKNPEKHMERARLWHEQNPERSKELQQQNYRRRVADPVYREALRKRGREFNREVKAVVFKHYGGACACCGEASIEFLCIDHIAGNGNKHRREIKLAGGSVFYHWLKRNGLPLGFQVLCHNCNMAKSCYGVCPHQKGRG